MFSDFNNEGKIKRKFMWFLKKIGIVLKIFIVKKFFILYYLCVGNYLNDEINILKFKMIYILECLFFCKYLFGYVCEFFMFLL